MSQRQKITNAILIECSDAQYAVDSLGAEFSAYVLKKKYRRQLNIPDPEPIDRKGGAVVLFAFAESESARALSPFFNDAFFLPFVWRKGERDSPFIPVSLCELTKKIRTITQHPEWGLFLGPKLDRGYDLSGFVLQVESAFAPLAAALELVALGGKPKPFVFGSGAWQERMEKVAAITAKVGTVRDLSEQTKMRARLFVPAEQESEARKAAKGEVDIHVYPSKETNWLKALAPHLRALDAPPDRRTDEIEERLAYANRYHVASDRNYRKKYYLEHIVVDLADSLRKQSAVVQPLGVLVLALSFSFELTVLLLNILRPQKVYLLVTPATIAAWKQISPLTKQFDIEKVDYVPGKEHKMMDHCRAWLSLPQAGVDGRANDTQAGRPNAVEITAGKKNTAAMLLSAAWSTNSHVFYLEHEMKDGFQKVGTEKLSRLDWSRPVHINSGRILEKRDF
jgi:hypothetical protein